MARTQIILIECGDDEPYVLPNTEDGQLVERAAHVTQQTPFEVVLWAANRKQHAGERAYHNLLRQGILPVNVRQRCESLVTPSEVAVH